jgi:glycosyltransferase involved in cell wall biosynthesis
VNQKNDNQGEILEICSIITPVYNAGSKILELAQSIKAQTSLRYEWVIVDDGSTDVITLEHLAELRAFATVVVQTNGGPSVARNTGIAHSKGRWLLFLDADDFIAPTKIEEHLKILESVGDLFLTVSDRYVFFGEEQPRIYKLESGFPAVTTDTPKRWLYSMLMETKYVCMVQTSQWVLPRALVRKAGIWSTYKSPNDDGEFFARMVWSSAGIRYVPNASVYYRLEKRGQSWAKSARSNETIAEGGLRSAIAIVDLFRSNRDPDELADLCNRLIVPHVFSNYFSHKKVARIALGYGYTISGFNPASVFQQTPYRTISCLFGWRSAIRVQRLKVIVYSFFSSRAPTRLSKLAS